ncbi:hypothetical protein Ddc_11427 [Ditylenchus destructor]|nr:hypothetical protein Ddc_11427 [Ditylenchus destructor]
MKAVFVVIICLEVIFILVVNGLSLFFYIRKKRIMANLSTDKDQSENSLKQSIKITEPRPNKRPKNISVSKQKRHMSANSSAKTKTASKNRIDHSQVKSQKMRSG